MTSSEVVHVAMRRRIEILHLMVQLMSEAAAINDLDVGTFHRMVHTRRDLLADWPELPQGPRPKDLQDEVDELKLKLQGLDAQLLHRGKVIMANLRRRLSQKKIKQPPRPRFEFKA